MGAKKSDKVLRTAVLKLKLNKNQLQRLNIFYELMQNRSKDIILNILSFAPDIHTSGLDVRENGNIEKRILRYPNEEKLTISDKKCYKELYELIIDTPNSGRIIRNAFMDKNCKTGKKIEESDTKNSAKLGKLIERMLQNGLLPVMGKPENLVVSQDNNYHSLTLKQDYACFAIAVDYLKSWDDRNKATKQYYEKFVKKHQDLENIVTEDGKTELNKWLEKYDLFITKKIAAKFEKFGFETRLDNYHFDYLKSINDDVNFWCDLFKWKVSSNKKEMLRKTSILSLPDYIHSPRAVRFGVNYEYFQIDIPGDNGIVDTVKVRANISEENINIKESELFSCMRTKYFKDLRISLQPPRERKNGSHVITENNYVFKYKRGNVSDFDLENIAELNEMFLYKKKGQYYISFPLTLKETESHNLKREEAKEMEKLYFNCDPVLKDGEWKKDIVVMGIDLGITTPVSYCITKTISEGYIPGENYEIMHEGIIGATKDKEYENKIKNVWDTIKKKRKSDTEEKTNDLFKKMNDYKKLQLECANMQSEIKRKEDSDNLQAEKNLLQETRKFLLELKNEIVKDLEHLKRDVSKLQMVYNLIPHKDRNLLENNKPSSRSSGVSSEQLMFIRFYQSYVCLLQKWTFLNSKKLRERKDRNDLFAKHFRYLNNLKLDFRKKVAQKIVNVARQHGVNILVYENLESFNPDESKSSNSNSLLMIWGKGEICKWIKHFAGQYGIVAIAVNPKYTSQIHYLTGNFGYRLWKNFYHKENGVIQPAIDADINAAKNIVARFHSREANMPQIVAKRIEGSSDFALWNETKIDSGHLPEETDGGEGKFSQKRQLMVIKKLFGTEYVIVSANGEFKTITKALAKKYTLEKKKGDYAYVNLYQHGGKWITKSGHDKIKEEWKEKLKSNSSIVEAA